MTANNPSYTIKLKSWNFSEKFEGGKATIYKRFLYLMPENVVQTWYYEVQKGRKDGNKFISPIEVCGFKFETSMAGSRAESYIEKLLNIGMALDEVESWSKNGESADKPKAQPPKEKKVEKQEEKPKEEKPIEQPKKADRKPKWFGRALAYLDNGLNLYLYGEAGTGKGYNSRKLACELNPELKEHDAFYQVNKVGDEYQLLGFNNANGQYVKTRFYEACKFAAENPNTKPLFMFDEMDVSSPDALKCFNEAVASKEMTFPSGEFLQFPNLLFVAAGNTLGNGSEDKYVANVIDKSTLDRYAIIKTEYETEIELMITNGDKELVTFIDEFRKEVQKCSLNTIVSYRSLERLFRMKKSGLDLHILLEDCLLKGMASDDVRMISNNIRCDNVWTTALKKCGFTN